MLIKKALSLKDPNRESNIKHCTANELSDDKNKRKAKRYKVSKKKQFMSYEEGQFERIFGEKTNTR